MKINEKELTPKQEDLIGDGAYHERKLMEEEEKEHKIINKKYKITYPMDPEKLDKILKKIGRKKLDNNEKYCDLKEIKEVKVNE